ncbi:MAG: hypothetical protein WBD22_10205 [Pyrinomonadaceae bacterium]
MSMQNFTSIPFKIESGLSTVNGIAKFSSAGVVLEFESKLFGLISEGVKEVRLPITEILDVRFKKGVFKRGAKIEIRMRSFAKQSQVPNNDGKISLKLVADDFDRASEAVGKLHRDLQEELASLPPAHTPLSQLFQDDDSDDETKKLN